MTESLLRRVPEQLPTARVAPGIEPRLVRTGPDGSPLGLAGEQELGHLTKPLTPESVAHMLDSLGRARLQGRGGAGFPAHVKWRTAAAAEGQRVVVANGHEGEPASGKDRWLLLNRPHLVLEGLLIAAVVVGACRVIVCVSRDDTAASVRAAIADLVEADLVPAGVGEIEVIQLDHRYVTGEESALIQGINGKNPVPTFKPPRPFEVGVDGLPTLVQNVETLAHAAWIHHHGPARFGELGTHNSPGTALFTINGGPAGCTLIEAPLGIRIDELLELAGITPDRVARVLLGGWFGGVHDSSVLGLESCFVALKVKGSGLGCASMTVISPEEDVRAIVAELGTWYAGESAQQCGVCRNATRAIGKALVKNAEGHAEPIDFQNLSRWGTSLQGRGACALLDGAATLARSTVSVVSAKEFVGARAHDQKENR